MIYIPKNSTTNKPGEYTGGGILFYITGENYSGFYIVQNNIPFSTDTNGTILERLYFTNDTQYLNYKQLNNDNDDFLIIPFLPKPNKKDYENNNITRYFIKRKFSVEIDITEVSKDIYTKLKSLNNASTQLYEFFELVWIIVGNKEEVKLFNYNSVQEKEKLYQGITKYLSNLLQFWKIK